MAENPRDLGQVQGDEIRVKMEGAIVWMAMAIQLRTRLWLGGTLSTCRDTALITRLMQKVRACALCRPLLSCADGCSAYVKAIRALFREPLRLGQKGRPSLRPWDNLSIAQVVKQYVGKRVVGVDRRLAQGSMTQVNALLRQTQGRGTITTAYIERLYATFRSRLAALVRRGRALARQTTTLHQAMHLVGSAHNLCTYHQSLRAAIHLPSNRCHWVPRTPAIAAGITDHLWTVQDLLSF